MAKVIRIDKKQAKRKTHKECGAVIEYFENELEYKTISDYGGGSDRYAFLTCPNCGKTMSWEV
jgi:hypothetical protein